MREMTEAEIAAYRILDNMQRARDFYLLREMNGKKVAGRMQASLGVLDRVGYRIDNSRTKAARAAKRKKQLAE